MSPMALWCGKYEGRLTAAVTSAIFLVYCTKRHGQQHKAKGRRRLKGAGVSCQIVNGPEVMQGGPDELQQTGVRGRSRQCIASLHLRHRMKQ